MRNRSRPAARRVPAILLLLGVSLLGPIPEAMAHDELVGSTPASGAQVSTSPTQVSLTFNEEVQPGPNVVTVRGPDGTPWDSGAATVQGTVVTEAVRPFGPAGQYTIDYRVLSEDGHPVSGTVTFTFSPVGTVTPQAPAPPRPATTATDSAPNDGATPVWPWIAGAVALIALGAAVALRIGRDRP